MLPHAWFLSILVVTVLLRIKTLIFEYIDALILVLAILFHCTYYQYSHESHTRIIPICNTADIRTSRSSLRKSSQTGTRSAWKRKVVHCQACSVCVLTKYSSPTVVGRSDSFSHKTRFSTPSHVPRSARLTGAGVGPGVFFFLDALST